MKILHIWKHIEHHSPHSGYDQLSHYLDCTHYRPGKIFHFLYSRNPKRFRWVKPIDPEWYNFEYFCLEMELLVRRHLVRDTIFHILYGENQFRYLGHALLRRGNRVVASFHQPASVFNRVIPDARRLAKADAVVVVGSSQVDFFRGLTGRDNIYLVPHGVDTEFFQPPPQRDFNGPLRAMVVGWWLRDVETIRRVMEACADAAPGRIEFHVVTFPWCHKFYEGLTNVTLYSNVPDEQLRSLYQRSHLLLLPMLDCTANNAVLEAMACALPVFTAEAGSIRDYVNEDHAVIAPAKRPGVLTDALLAAERDRDWLARLGEASRQRVMQFAWPAVAQEMRAAYRFIS